jgi:hypothetical protein
MNSYSEDGCDSWIFRNLPVPASGFYVDAGCAWPAFCNQCHWLRERGWGGLNIDANAAFAGEWVGHKFIHAVVSTEPMVRFAVNSNAALSRIAEEGELRTAKTLHSILEENGIERVDFLSLDLEGGEYDALLSFGLGRRNNPPIIVSEYRTAALNGSEPLVDDRVRDHLLALDYSLVHETFSNRVFYKP